MSSDQVRNTILDAFKSTILLRSRCRRFLSFDMRTTPTSFSCSLEGGDRMAGTVVTSGVADIDEFVRTKFPEAKVICSAVPECNGTIRPIELKHWADASTIDVSVVRSPLGVAETGSVLLSDLELQVNTIAFLSHDLVVLLDADQIVQNRHDAYRHPYFKARPYSLLMTGPSRASFPISPRVCR